MILEHVANDTKDFRILVILAWVKRSPPPPTHTHITGDSPLGIT